MNSVVRIIRVVSILYTVDVSVIVGCWVDIHCFNVSWSKPLANDQEIHPEEKVPKDEDLRDELKENVLSLSEVNRVQALKEDTKRHLQDSEDD